MMLDVSGRTLQLSSCRREVRSPTFVMIRQNRIRHVRNHPNRARSARQRLLLLASCLFSISCAAQAQETGFGPVPVGMTVQLNDEHYDIRGATAAELRRAMRESGPTSEGRRWDGNTQWNVRWRFRYEMQGGSCRMSDVTVEYTSTITMPRWNAPANAPAVLRRQWLEYERALRAHEEGHRNIGAEAAREVLRLIRTVTSPQCQSISEEANALGRRTLDTFRALQRQYDAETVHGRTQGATWPPR